MYKYFKRLCDIFLSLILLIIFAVPMLVIAYLIKKEDGDAIIFKQRRVGKNCKVFNIYKFRTMKANRKQLGDGLTHEQMVTQIGRFLRRTSLDELPQLFNVLKGDMSFIGPRPWIEEYYFWFTKEQRRRSNCTPGISGLAQVKGRNGISIFKKIEYDLEYVDNISLKMDLKILKETIKTVVEKTEAEISEKGIKEEILDLKMQNLNYTYEEVVWSE